MGLQTMVDSLLVKLLKSERTSDYLRHRFRRLHDIDIGKWSYGCFDRWRMSRGTRIGRYCSFANSVRIIDADHPLTALSTHPLFYEAEAGLLGHHVINPRPTVIEDDVWLGHNVTVTPGCKLIGRGAVIAAGAVVTRDVPRYAVVAGMPATVKRYRFTPDVIEAVEATRWWELEPDDLRRGGAAAPGFLAIPTVEGARAFAAALGPAADMATVS